ncbi:MAG: hypothetical protein U0U46_17950 [Saprospiraceae bacterium]
METNAQNKSRHLLFFAFRWKPSTKWKDTSAPLDKLLAALKASGWEEEQHSLAKNFSEYNFFHDFTHSAIFRATDSTSSVWNFYKTLQGPFILTLSNAALGTGQEGETTEFKLTILRCRLNIYEHGVGVLSLMLDNTEHADPGQVLAINDLIRRLYPQYLDWNEGIRKPQRQGLLPIRVGMEPFIEDFSAYPVDNNRDQLTKRFLPRYILGLLGDGFKADPADAGESDFVIEHEFDDRQFIVSCYLNAELSKQLSANKSDGEPAWLTDPFWYAYVFADKGEPSIKNKAMMATQLEQATYPRWTEGGTFYGASRYSFVSLASPENGWVMGPMSGNYARLVELCLMQRASVLRFREDAAEIARQLPDSRQPRALTEQIRRLYGEFIRFSNRFNFQEATTYEQGIELYDLLRRQMRVDEQVGALKAELQELHQYAAELHETARNRTLDWLTFLGAVFLIPTFLVSYFGFYDSWKTLWERCHILLFWTLAVGIGIAALVFYFGLLHRGGIWRAVGVVLLVAYMVVALSMPLLLEWFPQWFGLSR